MEERPELAELQNHIVTNKWFNLGLQLGLTDSDLEAIELKYLDVGERRREMLSIWLKTSLGACRKHLLEALKTDSVSELLVAEKYSTFIQQLSHGEMNSSDENASLATTHAIRPGDRAVDIFKHHHDILYKVLKNPMDVADTLYIERVIGNDVLDEMRPKNVRLSIKDQTRVLFTTLEMVIRANHYNLKVFGTILCRYPSTCDVGNAILTEYREKLPKAKVEYDVSRTYEKQFLRKRNELGMLFGKVMQLLKKQEISLDDLKCFLSLSYPECTTEVENSESVGKVFAVVRAYSSLDNIHRLEAIVTYFELKGGEALIQKYNESIEQFCKDISIHHAYGQSLMDCFKKHLLKSETIVFVLQWDKENKVLHDVRGLFIKAFGRLADDIEVNVMFQGNSIIIVCYAPSHLHGVLIHLVQDNEEDLIKEKIISVSIGGGLILKREENGKDEETQLKDDLKLRGKHAEESISIVEHEDIKKTEPLSTPSDIESTSLAEHEDEKKTDTLSIPLDIDSDSKRNYETLLKLNRVMAMELDNVRARNNAAIQKLQRTVQLAEKRFQETKHTAEVAEKNLLQQKDEQITELMEELEKRHERESSLERRYTLQLDINKGMAQELSTLRFQEQTIEKSQKTAQLDDERSQEASDNDTIQGKQGDEDMKPKIKEQETNVRYKRQFEIPPHQGLSTFTEDIKTCSSKIKSGEVSAVSDLVGVTEKIVLVVQSDDNINLTQVAEIIDCFGNIVKCLLEEHDKLQECVKTLEDRVKHLQNLEEALLVGQIASKVETVLVQKILDGTNVSDSRYLTIHQLENALSDCGRKSRQSKSIFKSQEDISKGNENWDRLETTFRLDSDLYGAIKSLRSHKNIMAHPGMSVRQARERLANCIDRDIAYRLLDILEKASVKNIET